MNLEKYIEQQMQKHLAYAMSFEKERSAFGVEYRHQKTRRAVTLSEKDDFIRNDALQTAKRIIEKSKLEQ